jgi:hypothetical protein
MICLVSPVVNSIAFIVCLGVKSATLEFGFDILQFLLYEVLQLTSENLASGAIE